MSSCALLACVIESALGTDARSPSSLSIDRHNAKFKDYTGAEAKADVIETEITRAMT